VLGGMELRTTTSTVSSDGPGDGAWRRQIKVCRASTLWDVSITCFLRTFEQATTTRDVRPVGWVPTALLRVCLSERVF
jgi:hypothetical protein